MSRLNLLNILLVVLVVALIVGAAFFAPLIPIAWLAIALLAIMVYDQKT